MTLLEAPGRRQDCSDDEGVVDSLIASPALKALVLNVEMGSSTLLDRSLPGWPTST